MAKPVSQLVWLLFAAVILGVSAQKKTLVLLQENNDSFKSQYSVFFDTLASYGFDLTFRGYRESSYKLKEYDTWLYDNLVLFAPKAEGASSLILIQPHAYLLRYKPSGLRPVQVSLVQQMLLGCLSSSTVGAM